MTENQGNEREYKVLRRLVDALPDAIMTTTEKGVIIEANPAAHLLFHRGPSALHDTPVFSYLVDEYDAPLESVIGRIIRNFGEVRNRTVYVKWGPGPKDRTPCSLTAYPLIEENKETGERRIDRVVGIFQDVGPLARELEMLHEMKHSLTESLETKTREAEHNHVLAHTDDLTGLHNMRAFWKALREAVEQERIGRGSLAVFYFDADGFSKKNVAHGHQATDGMIRAVANRLRGVTETHGGFVARYGGDEFCAFFRSVNGTIYRQIADEFADALNFKYETRKVNTFIGVSIGGTICMNGEISPPQEMLDEADEAMYESKQSGRDEEKTKRHVLRSAPLHSSVPPKP